MKKIVTAIGNEQIYNCLKEKLECEILGKDIQYQEGIFELFDQNIEIEYLIMSDFLEGPFSLEEIIKKIKKRKKDLKIILIYSKENQIKNKLLMHQKIEEAIYYEKIIKKELLEKKAEGDKELKKEIESLKEEIKQIKKEKRRYASVIAFVGDHSAGKTSICFMMAQMLTFQKILMIDMDYERKVLLKITQKEQKEEFERKINKRIYICDGEEIIQNFEVKIESLKQKYDFILIDTNTEDPLKINSELSRVSDLTIFVVESSFSGNLKGIDFFIKNEGLIDWKKTKILFNRFSKYSLTRINLIKNFRDFSILGILRDTKNYAQNMNFRYRKHFGGFQEWKEYQKIIKRIKFPERMSEGNWTEKLKYQ